MQFMLNIYFFFKLPLTFEVKDIFRIRVIESEIGQKSELLI